MLLARRTAGKAPGKSPHCPGIGPWGWALLAALGAGNASAQVFASWAHSRTIFFNTAAAGADVSGNVVDFPVLIKLNSGNFNFGEALAGGADLRFEDKDGTPLAYQIESWDGAGQTADIWVLVPQVDGNSTQDLIKMYWGKAGSTDASNPPNVFQSSGGFGGVWHLHEDGNTSAGGYADATGNAFHGTGYGMNSASDAPAIAGNGQIFNGSRDIDFGAGSGLHGGGSLTLETWFTRPSSPGNVHALLSRPYTTNAPPYHEYFLSINPAGNVSFDLTTGGAASAVGTSTTASNSAWHHVAAVYDGSSMRIYLDGALENSAGKSGTIGNYSQAVKLGAFAYDGTMRFNGTLDEVRISTVARSADWIKLSYANQKPSQNLVVMAARVWDGGGADDSWNNPANWNGDVLPTADEDVLFDGTSNDNATLSANVAVRGIVFTGSYTGTFSFSNYALTVNGGPADFRSGGTINPGTGGLVFASADNQGFHPKAGAAFPALTQIGGGTTTLASNNLSAASLNVVSGAFNISANALGLALSGNLDLNGGTLNAGGGSLDVDGDVNLVSGNLICPTGIFTVGGSVSQSGGTLAPNGGTLVLDGTSPGKTLGLAAAIDNLTVNGSGGTWTAGSHLSVNGAFSLAAGTLDLSSNIRILSAASYSQSGGSLNAATGDVDVNGNFSLTGGTFAAPGAARQFTVAGSFTKAAGAAFNHNGGTLALDGATTGKTLDIAGALYNLTVNGSGGAWTVTNNGLNVANALTLAYGSLNLGSVVSSAGSLSASGGTLDFGSGSLAITSGDAYLGSLGTLTAGSGTLSFTAATGTQILGAKSGTTHPHISHTGAGLLQLSGYNLDCLSFSQSAGVLDFASYDIATQAGGNFTVTNGTASSFANLAARTVTVAGNASLSGSSGAGRLNLNPGAAWYLNASGTASAQFATVANAQSGGYATVACGSCFSAGNNNNWTFATAWDGGGGDANWSTPANWSSDAVPSPDEDLTFNAGSANATLDLNVTIKSVVFTGGYTGAFYFGSSTLSVNGNADFRSGGSIIAGSGTLAFTGAGAQTFIPKAGASFPAIWQNGNAGTTTVTTNALNAGNLTLGLGSFNLGASLTHSVGGVSGTGGLNFGTSNLNAAGNVDLSAATVAATTASTLAFTGSSAQTYAPNVSEPDLNLVQNGAGGTTVLTGNITAPSLAIAVGTFNLGAGRTHQITGNLTTSGGGLDFGSSTLRVAGTTIDLTGLAGVTAGTGTLELNGASPQTLTPKASAGHPGITQNGAGGTTVATNGLSAQTLTIATGAFHAGAGLSHAFTGFSSGGGELDFGSSTLGFGGSVINFNVLAVLTPGTGVLAFTGASAQTFTPKNGSAHPRLRQSGAGITTLSTYGVTAAGMEALAGEWDNGGFNVIVNGDVSVAGGILDVTAGTLDVNGNLAVSSGTLLMPSGNLTLTGNFSRTGGTVTHNSGTLVLDGASPGKTLDISQALNNLTLNGAGGGWTVANNGLNLAGNLDLTAGGLSLGSLVSSAGSVSGSGGALDFAGGTLRVTAGNAVFSGLASLTAGTGTLEFNAPTGIQSVEARAATTHPHIVHSGAGTLRLMNASLTCNGFSQSAGAFNFNNYNLTTVSSGNFTVDNGNSGSLLNLGGRLITVAGNAAFNGATSADRLNLNPGFTWTLAVSGTLSATLASLGYNTAGSPGGSCSNCANMGNNSGWTFAVSWDGGGGDNNWTTAANWGSDYVPGSQDDVRFDATSAKNAALDADATVKSVVFTTGYTGAFSFGSSALSIAGALADFRSGGTISAGTGSLNFISGSAQDFYPKAGQTFPALVQNGSGGTTVAGADLTAGNLTLTLGTFKLGSGLTHSVAAISGGGGLDFQTSNLNATGNVDLSSATLTATSANTLAFTGSTAQTYNPNASVTALNLSQNGAGGTTVSGGPFTTPTLSIASGTLSLGASLTHSVTAGLNLTGGGLDLGTSTLQAACATVDLRGLATLSGSGTLALTGTSAQTLYPKASATLPNLTQSGTGGTLIAAHALMTGALAIQGGTLDLGGGFAHQAASLSTTGGGFSFNASTLGITSGDADFSGLATLTAGTGTLEFTAASGTQVFTPKSAATFPTVVHSGAGVLQLSGYPLTCAGFAQSAGTLDFNGQDLSTAYSGNLTVTGGGSASFANLGGRTLTVAGNAAFTGQTGNRVNLDPASGWTLAVSGTLMANLARIAHCAATLSAGSATASADEGGNSNWAFSVTWDGGGGDNNWSTGGNWSSDAAPAAGNDVVFDATSPKNCTLDAAAAVKSFTLGSGYTGNFSFSSNTLSVTGDADFRSGGTLSAGSGTLAFTGSSAQTFIPKAGSVFPDLIQNGAGGTTVTTNALNAGVLTLANGAFRLGTGFTHVFAGISATGSATLDFGTSTAQTPGNVDLGSLGTLTAGSGTLRFTAASGTQTFVPKAGSVHPLILHAASGTLQIMGNALTCMGLTHTAGGFDLNGQNLSVSGTGNLLVTGAATTVSGLASRTLTVGGNARFAGTAASKLDLQPAAAWTLAVTGTLTAANVRLAYSAATVSSGVADSSSNFGFNTGWSFLDSVKPADVTGFTATAVGGDSVALAWTPSASGDAETVMLRYRTDGDYPANSADGSLWRSVSSALSADTATGLAEKTVYHFAAFVKDSSGNYSPAGASARDTARTPDVTPPANVTAFTATPLSAAASALSWTASASADADSVMIRYRVDGAYPTGIADGTLWRVTRADRVSDTATGLAAKVLYHFGLFVRDSSGNWSAAAAAAQDTSLYENPVSGSIAVLGSPAYTRDPDPALAFTFADADSMRFGQPADTATAAWVALRSRDSLDLSAGADGKRVVLAQFKNVYGRRSPWYADSTALDRSPPAVALPLKAAYGWRDWPGAAAGQAKDALSGTDSVFLIRKRVADGAYFGGAAWSSAADTSRFRADSAFSAPMPASALADGSYDFTAYAKDKLGNVSAPVTMRFSYTDNRAPQPDSANLPDSVLQNQPVSWTLRLGDLDTGDSLATVSAQGPAWLRIADSSDTARGGYAMRRIYALTGTPGQADVSPSAAVAIQVRDLGGKTFTYSKSFRVVDVNDAPAFEPGQDTLTAPERATTRFVPRFADPDPKDKGTLGLLSAPAWAALQDSALVLRPGARDAGKTLVRLTVSDGRLLDTLDLMVTVANLNDAPVAFPGDGWQAPAAWKEDIIDSFTVVVVDMDKNDAVALTTPLPPFLTYRASLDSTGFNHFFRFTAKPVQKDTGAYPLRLRFADAAGAAGELTLNAKVAAVNDTPTAIVVSRQTAAGAARVLLDARDDDGNAASTRFHYRLADSRGDTVRSGICAGTALALHPLADGEYVLALAAEDQGGLRQPAYTLTTLSITGATSFAVDSARWIMMAYPGRVLAAAALGAGAAIATWDEASGDGSPGRYASGKSADSLARGKGYWARASRRVALSAPLADLIDRPFPLKLVRGKQGWNQIGNPYPYYVNLAATGLTFWEWDPARRDLADAKGILRPWGAYWVQVSRDTLITIKNEPWFNPGGAALARTAAGGPAAASARTEDWSLQLALAAGPYRDEANFLGIRRAGGAADPARIADAPKFGDYIALHFEKPGSGPDDSLARGFASDFRPGPAADEEWWDFSLENKATGRTSAELSLPGLEKLAARGLYAFLVDRGEAAAVADGVPVRLAMGDSLSHYALVITPHPDFAARLKGNFSISQNFPNPARELTTFRFFLPQAWGGDGKRLAKAYRLRLNVYDFKGRLAATVADGTFAPGSHALAWRPQSKDGNALAPGAYLYRLETAGFAKSLKLIVK